jgi:uncharacterized protein YdhG (YjbR/CyaY superfamily)
MSLKYKTVDEYIASFPAEIREKLETMRGLVKKIVPQAVEEISYQMPTFELDGKNLIHFAAFKNHIGVYPTPKPIVEFEKDLEKYKTAKGSIQLPLTGELPLEIITKILKFRINEVSEE